MYSDFDEYLKAKVDTQNTPLKVRKCLILGLSCATSNTGVRPGMRQEQIGSVGGRCICSAYSQRFIIKKFKRL
jgi:hypothetical protein